ncbi:MAG TPA: helix-turn-helix domain-containing protein [Pseudonocardiaceae bacterium]
MGRPKEHNETTASKLLAAAERVVETEGQDALSVRRIAAEAETTTRAVYSLFGSREGLLAALGTRAFQLLGASVSALPATKNSAADLVEAGLVFRAFAVEHRSLFALAVQRTLTAPQVAAGLRPAQTEALPDLRAAIERLEADGLLGGRPIRNVVYEFHALCEGLAAVELRGLMPQGEEEGLWRDALTALVAGFRAATMTAARP